MTEIPQPQALPRLPRNQLNASGYAYARLAQLRRRDTSPRLSRLVIDGLEFPFSIALDPEVVVSSQGMSAVRFEILTDCVQVSDPSYVVRTPHPEAWVFGPWRSPDAASAEACLDEWRTFASTRQRPDIASVVQIRRPAGRIVMRIDGMYFPYVLIDRVDVPIDIGKADIGRVRVTMPALHVQVDADLSMLESVPEFLGFRHPGFAGGHAPKPWPIPVPEEQDPGPGEPVDGVSQQEPGALVDGDHNPPAAASA